jgi:thiosulfate reductase cytochrome b subunit
VATAGPTYIASIPTCTTDAQNAPRHSAVVRLTHWINVLSFVGLVVSGFAIILAHPRFYWGETGGTGTPSVLDLPLPYMPGGPSGWGRNLHFLSAWLCVVNGALYLLSGTLGRHFRNNLLPARADMSWSSLGRVISNHLRMKHTETEASTYNPLQRLTYLGVIFVLFPVIIWTAFAMSPAIVSVFPLFVTAVGGHESARTIHFFAAVLLILFLGIHIVAISLSGFKSRVQAMITGRLDDKQASR